MPKGDDHFVLWPRYFDARRSRSEGRRVPDALAVKDPDARWVETAAARAKLSPELDESARDPWSPAERKGCVFVARQGSKEAVLDAVAREMRAGQDSRSA
jgi:signal recognition particle subunit SRP19